MYDDDDDEEDGDDDDDDNEGDAGESVVTGDVAPEPAS